MSNSTQPCRLKQTMTTKHSLKWVTGIFLMLLIFFNMDVRAQVNDYVYKNFTQRTSIYSPETKVYHIQGDYQIIGNMNLSLKGRNATTGPALTVENGGKDMTYVDVDDDPNTVNSSSAQLNFSTERGPIPNVPV